MKQTLRKHNWQSHQLSNNQKHISVLHAELGYALDEIFQATGRALELHFTGMFQPCEDCALGYARKGKVNKRLQRTPKNGRKLFFDVISPLTLPFGGKKHWLLVIGDSTDFALNQFLKESLS